MSLTDYKSLAVCFEADGNELLGVLERPEVPSSVGVVVIVGGPQYRVGSHRQFVLLARSLAEGGYAVLRFDQHGVGDSDGLLADFRDLDGDIRGAIDQLQREVPAVAKVVLWGLCDAASAAMMYAHSDDRVAGLVLLNPWVRSEQSLAAARMRFYYARRIVSGEFWGKLLSGRLDVMRSVMEFLRSLRRSLSDAPSSDEQDKNTAVGGDYIERMRLGLDSFDGPSLFVLSGDDITAAEFKTLVSSDRHWERVMSHRRVTVSGMSNANHTFSSSEWRSEVASRTLKWLARHS